jgi:hypothetical protein
MKPFKPIAAVILVSLFAVFGSAIVRGHLERRAAEKFLISLQQIQIAKTDSADAILITDPFREYRKQVSFNNQPALEFLFDNRSMSILKLAPYGNFQARIVFEDGVVVEKHASEYSSSSGCAVFVTKKRRGLGYPNNIAPANSPNYSVTGSWNSDTNRRQIVVDLDDTSSSVESRNSFKFNLSCLTALRGCSDAREMLPYVPVAPYKAH